MSVPRLMMTRAFRAQMLRQGLLVFVALIVVLLILVDTVSHKVFLVAALVLTPAAALTFNVMQRRAYGAYQQGLKR